MKFLFFLFPIIAFAGACPKNLESQISTCSKLECSRDDSRMLNKVFNTKEKFITNISVKKVKKSCIVEYQSEWTGAQNCKFPLEHLKGIIGIMGDSSTSEGLEMFISMESLSKVNSKKEFQKINEELNALRNKMMSKQVAARSFVDENPSIAKKINSFCKLDPKKGNAKKVAKYENYMKQLNERMAKIENATQAKMLKYGN